MGMCLPRSGYIMALVKYIFKAKYIIHQDLHMLKEFQISFALTVLFWMNFIDIVQPQCNAVWCCNSLVEKKSVKAYQSSVELTLEIINHVLVKQGDAGNSSRASSDSNRDMVWVQASSENNNFWEELERSTKSKTDIPFLIYRI